MDFPAHGRVICHLCDALLFECSCFLIHANTEGMRAQQVTCEDCAKISTADIRLVIPTEQPKPWGWDTLGRQYADAFLQAWGDRVLLVSSTMNFLDEETEWKAFAPAFKRPLAERFYNVIVGFGDDFQRFFTEHVLGAILNVVISGTHPRPPSEKEYSWIAKYDVIGCADIKDLITFERHSELNGRVEWFPPHAHCAKEILEGAKK